MTVDLWFFEKAARQNGCRRIAGVDEAGRGPLAGPVVAAAVILPEACCIDGINDSKKLSPRRREHLYRRIGEDALGLAVAIVGSARIDRLNIRQAARLAMAIAVECLDPAPDIVLIDGNCGIRTPIPQTLITRGDAQSISIAAASIVAKVTRDRIMARYDRRYPQYGFGRHKGYPTKAHREAIHCHGCSPIHRRTFRGVRELFEAPLFSWRARP